ncbi:hypothetical protein [uncultured Desulfobacter sp.]|uniref:hypothetical protein n=1 Tax=uncultured Desulfobacter sp. TaxID=240139 RepID=UPI002AAB63CD|nr:hypothetical protein [uncultured Desulfobacter sp.]
MRSFAKQVITSAAVAAGLTEAAVMDKPDKETVLLPEKRIQLSYLDEGLERKPRHVARMDGPEDAEHPYRVIRSRLYKTRLTVQAEVKSDDEEWLESFVKAFLLALPGKTQNDDADLVTIKVFKAVRSGFGTRTVEVFTKRANALHIRFTGMICTTRQAPLITDINLTDNLDYKEE